MSQLNISGLSLNVKWHNPTENLLALESFIDKISKSADILILPEMFSTGFTMNPAEVAEPLRGSTIKSLIDLSQKKGLLIGGSVVVEDSGKYYNRFVFCSANGIEMWYDKQYLFSPAGERDVYQSGNEKKIFKYRGWNICPQICYDLRFPESSRNNTGEIDLLIYVASWPAQRTNHWDALLKARAIENQCYVIGVNRTGTDQNGYDYLGHSAIYRFDGEQIAFDNEEEKIIEGILDLEKLKQYREKLPFLKDFKSNVGSS